MNENQFDAMTACLKNMSANDLIVSLAYGKCGENGELWSVDVLNLNNGESFEKPYAANDMPHAVSIAQLEARKLGWIE